MAAGGAEGGFAGAEGGGGGDFGFLGRRADGSGMGVCGGGFRIGVVA